jgi:photosystem II stability/assembly factor-like uncharacterized protein
MRILCLSVVSYFFWVTNLYSAPTPFFGDATIRAVQFVDKQEGWAVGDEGVVWHTIDGGETWERQSTGVRASLRAIHFFNPYTGWIVGRSELPDGKSIGVVLSTTDGGLKWTQVAINTVPGLNYVKFFNERMGIAVGDGSDTFPTGLFTTVDGGRTWKATPGERCSSWLTADFTDLDTGVLAGTWGKLAILRKGLFGAAQVDSLGGRSVKGMKINGKKAIAVGQGGLVLVSNDSAGVRWGFGDLKVPEELLASVDLNAVSVVGNHAWAVGRPGTVIFHSSDSGATWEMQKTGQILSLHGVQFIDENQGWAVGEMGTILTTSDGGKTWKVQKQDGQRAATLFIHSSGKKLPLDVVALLGHEEGYRTVGVRVISADPNSASHKEATETDRLIASMRDSGGTSGESLWQFPIARYQDSLAKEDLLGSWDKLHGENKSSQQLLRQLVLTLRLWRPEVIVTDGWPTNDASEMLLMEALKEAFKQAGDPKAFPEQLESLGLEVWGAKKLYLTWEKADPTIVHVEVSGLASRLEDTPRDFVFQTSRLLNSEAVRVNDRYFRLLATRLKDAVSHTDLMQGIDLVEEGTARRKLPLLTQKDEETQKRLEKAFQARKNLEMLAKPDANAFANPEAALAMIDQTLKGMPIHMGAMSTYTIATNYAQGGHWHLAREAYLRMIDRYPGHPLTLEACRWVMRHQSSSEAWRREELGHYLLAKMTSYHGLEGQEESGNIRRQGNTGVEEIQIRHDINKTRELKKWTESVLVMEKQLSAYGPLVSKDPAMQLCVQSARRQLGMLEDVHKWCSNYLAETAIPNGSPNSLPGTNPWRDCILAEAWMINRTLMTTSPKPLAFCRQTSQRPKLDGKLDDPCWLSAKPMVLQKVTGDIEGSYQASLEPSDAFCKIKSRTEGDTPKTEMKAYTQAMFAFDSHYLYIAVQCVHPEGKQAPKLEKRSRDMNMDGSDRVSIMLDLDRDYQTYFHFQVDQRGALAEDCWGDKTWNPKWLVATHSEATGWTTEIAIPLHELSGIPLTVGRVWACNVTRTIPGKGIQAWSIPADAIPRPEGMGLLQFAGEPR